MHSLKKIIFICSCLALASCGNFLVQKKPLKPIDPTAQESLSSDFLSVKEAVFSTRCISCHQQYDTYQGVVRELAAIQDAIATDRMPKNGGPLTASQKAIITAWVSKGAPEKRGEAANPPPNEKPEPNWASLSASVIFPKCLVCHNPQGQAKFLDLSNRQIIFDNRDRTFAGGKKLLDFESPENSYLIEILKNEEEPMPPASSNIARLTDDELNTVLEWIALGLP